MTPQVDGTVVPISNDNQIYFTLFRSTKPVIKYYRADFSKTIAAKMYQANYALQSTPSLDKFDTYLNSLSAYDTITLGVTQQTSGLSLTAKDFREGKDCIYRGKEHIKFCNEVYSNPKNLSLLLFDIDYDDSMPEHFKLDTPEEVRESLIKLFPLLSNVSMLIRPSSSAGIYNTITQEKRSIYPSWHIYPAVANATSETVKNFVELLKRRAWLPSVNLAYAKITEAGVYERYYFDAAVFSAERLIVEPEPILESPLAKEVIPSVIYEGGALDLASIDYNLEPDYREAFAKEKGLLVPSLKGTSSIAKRDTTSSSIMSTPQAVTDKINISSVTAEQLKNIHLILAKTPALKAKELLTLCDKDIIKVILIFIGYDVDYNYKFKLRLTEKTASASINFNGYIKDFGGTFAGTIINLLMELYTITFREAFSYLKSLFGISAPNLDALQELPTPKELEAKLTIIN